MLVRAWRELEQDDGDPGFETEYRWENFIIRLWLYRATVKTLAKLRAVAVEARSAIATFDDAFTADGKNQLKALRDMIEHFDDYAAGQGRGPADRASDLDPWRSLTRDRYEKGQFVLTREASYAAAIKLRADAAQVSQAFICWYKAEGLLS